MRTKTMSQLAARKVRMVGLSTTLANAKDVADWLEVDDVSNARAKIVLQHYTTGVHRGPLCCILKRC